MQAMAKQLATPFGHDLKEVCGPKVSVNSQMSPFQNLKDNNQPIATLWFVEVCSNY